MVEADAADDIKGLALQSAVDVDGLIRPVLQQAVPQALSDFQNGIKAIPAQLRESVRPLNQSCWRLSRSPAILLTVHGGLIEHMHHRMVSLTASYLHMGT